MKKEYVSPELEVVLLESNENMMADKEIDGGSEPESSYFDNISFHGWLQNLPNGYMLSEEEVENFRK